MELDEPPIAVLCAYLSRPRLPSRRKALRSAVTLKNASGH